MPFAKSLRIRFDVVSVHRPTANQHSLSFPNWSVCFLWRICYCASICHDSCCTDECDMDGKTFVDLGSGVGQVLWWHPLCVALWQQSLGWHDHLILILGRSAWWSLHCPAHPGLLLSSCLFRFHVLTVVKLQLLRHRINGSSCTLRSGASVPVS